MTSKRICFSSASRPAAEQTKQGKRNTPNPTNQSTQQPRDQGSTQHSSHDLETQSEQRKPGLNVNANTKHETEAN